MGLSATLSHSYPSVKHISKILRQLFPDIWIVVGGHITSSANVILNRTETDICVVGDGIPQPIALVILSEQGKRKTESDIVESLERTLEYIPSNIFTLR